MPTKICSKCKVEKDINDFHKKKSIQAPNCKICVKTISKVYYNLNKEQKILDSKLRYERSKDEILDYHKKYYVDNKKLILYKNSNYRKRNRMKINKNYKNKINENPKFNMVERLRSRLKTILKLQNTKKSNNTIKLLGCSATELKEHLEKQFQPGMGWDNRNLWHIDHILPCNEFDLRNSEEQEICFHYTNLQPLWAIDNIKKSDKII